MPREWAWAWQVCRAGDEERMDRAQRVVDAFRDCTTLSSGKRPTLACLKRALVHDGVISSGCVAPGTPSIPADEIERHPANERRIVGRSGRRDRFTLEPQIDVVIDYPLDRRFGREQLVA